jgi:hypothetical protein
MNARPTDQQPGVCQHDLLEPNCTVVVADADPFVGHCPVCDVTWTTRAPGTGQQPAQPSRLMAKHQPCGCIVCTCEDDLRCHGCGAKHCGTHPVGQIPNAVYEQQPGQPGSGEAVDVYLSIPHLQLMVAHERLRRERAEASLAAARQRIAALESELETERARGIHTCHDQCQRPLCVAQRRIAELRGCLAELTALVNGESPALLNEDSGGDGELAVRIDNALEDPT